jgi:hypothetical protein
MGATTETYMNDAGQITQIGIYDCVPDDFSPELMKYTLLSRAKGQVNADGLPSGLAAGLEPAAPPGGGSGGPPASAVQGQLAGIAGGAQGPITRVANQGGNVTGLASAGQASPVGASNGRA